MPKMKTHRGTKKRIKLTASGKLLRRNAYKGHNLSKKSSARKRGYSKDQPVSSSERQRIKRTLGV